MTNEEFDRRTELLLDQQIKLYAGMLELQEAQITTEKKIAQAADVAKRALGVAEVTVEGVSQLTGRTERLVSTVSDGFKATAERMEQIDVKIDALFDSQMRTDKRLRDLTDLSERYFRKDDPGSNGSEN